MKTRLALVACYSECDGSWAIARGNEKALRITHLMQGEQIRFDIEVGDLRDSIIFNQPGLFTLPWKRFERYKVAKCISPLTQPSPTTVEVVLHESTQSISGPTHNSD
jgi:hypothetical protein